MYACSIKIAGITTVRKRKVPITGIKIIKMRKDDRDGTGKQEPDEWK